MDLLTILNSRRKYLRYPTEILDNFESSHYNCPQANFSQNDGWVTARFSAQNEEILFLGDDPGNIGVYNVAKMYNTSLPQEEKQLHFFPAHNGAIMDIVSVPNKENQIVSISGDSMVRCWDLGQAEAQRTSELYQGHEGSVRSVNFAPDDSNIFATGSRDGQVKVWDMRVSQSRKNNIEICRTSTISYRAAHPIQNEKPCTPKSKAKIKVSGHSVTSVVFIDEFLIASASSSAETGLRIWDIRRPTHNGEGHPASILKIPVTKQRQAGFGVTSLAIDRFKSSLYASCTNSVVFEYAIQTTIKSPVRAYSGATIRDYYTQVACSPVSDMVACGSDDNQAVFWDIQDQHSYVNDSEEMNELRKKRGVLPKWACGGHESKVLCVGWNCNGKYFMSMDEKGLRIWSESQKVNKFSCCSTDLFYDTSNNTDGPRLMHEKVTRFELSESDETMTKIDGMSILGGRKRTSSILRSSPRKRAGKRPLTNGSPFKISPTKSPRAKILKISTSPFKMSNVLNEDPTTSKGQFTPKIIKKPPKNSYNFRYPTENLPNFVYDEFVRKMLGTTNEQPMMTTEKLSRTSRKRIDEWWKQTGKGDENQAGRLRLPSVSEFGESACSKVVPESLLSPRKLVVKANPSPSSASSSRPPTTTPKSSKNSKTSRNLLHYFNKKNAPKL